MFVSISVSEQHAGVALSAVIRALDELKMVAIVRYAYGRSSNPQIGAAFPFIKKIVIPGKEDHHQLLITFKRVACCNSHSSIKKACGTN